MADVEIGDLNTYRWMESRIPALPALVAFAKTEPPDPAIVNASRRAGRSRWYVVEGGHRVVIPYDGEPFDESLFKLEEKAWDHEHCDVCRAKIRAMTLCHVTEPDEPYVLLCAGCFKSHVRG